MNGRTEMSSGPVAGLDGDDLAALVLAAGDEVIAAADALNQLDSVAGDGDLGVTLTLGFRAVRQALSAGAGDTASTPNPNRRPGPEPGPGLGLDPAEVLARCGQAFAEAAASTFGTLVATMFMRAGKAVRGKGKEAIGPADAASILRAAVEGVKQRGGADVGDKTVLDALVPAAEALERAARSGAALPAAIDAALEAARKGADQTASLRSRAGRSAWFAERTAGVKDPGAVALVLFFEGAARFVHGGR